MSDFYTPYVAVIASISEARGIELVQAYDKAVNADDFCKYLVKLSKGNAKQPFGLLMDNLRAHKTAEVIEKCRKLGITPLWNIPYFPDGNPCEQIFSQVKRSYKRERLHHLVNRK